MEENTPSKVGSFVSSAVSRILNLVMILLILALAGVIVFFWNKNQLLEQENKTLQEQNDNFTEMNSQAKVRDVVVKEENKETVAESNLEINNIVNNPDIKISETKNENVIPSNLVTYKNNTFKYVVNYPSTWTAKSSHLLEEGSEIKKDMNIEFYKNNVLVLNVIVEVKTKVGTLDLSKRVLQSNPYPIDKTTISGISKYKVGNLDGYRRLVSVSDPARQGLEYITESDEFVYYLSTNTTTENNEIVDFVKSFKLSQ